MYQRKQRRFRRHSNGRNRLSNENGYIQSRPRSNSFSNNQARNHFRTPQSAEKLFEKYNALAKEALSSGDKTLSENYFQHADHFMRIIEDKNKSRNQIKVNDIEKSGEEKKNLSVVDNINQTEENKKKD